MNGKLDVNYLDGILQDKRQFHSQVNILQNSLINAKTRSTQRAQTFLAEAGHYSHIVHCKNVEPWL